MNPGGAQTEEQETRTGTLPKHAESWTLPKTNTPSFLQNAALETKEQLLKKPSKSQLLPNYLWQAAFLRLI